MKDIIFSIYRYKIDRLQAVQGELFNKGEKRMDMKGASKEMIFESLIPEKNKIIELWNAPKKNKNGEEVIVKDTYNNRVLEHRDGIIVLELQANGSKLIYDEDWNKHPEPNHMPFYVIIDNRENHGFIAIQRAAMDTDKSAEVLQNSFNYLLNKAGYRFEVVRLKNQLKFIEAVYHIKDKLKDNVSKVVFDFDKNLDEKKKLSSRFVHALSEWIGRFADSGQVTANISNDERLKNEEVQQDLELMAELCSTNPNYNLLVRFKRFGLYRYGHDIKAQFGMDEDVLSLFVEKDKDSIAPKLLFETGEEQKQVITLPAWLDDIMKLYKDYEEEALSVKKRRRVGRL